MEQAHICEASGSVDSSQPQARDVLATLIRAGESRNGYVYAPAVLQEAVPLARPVPVRL